LHQNLWKFEKFGTYGWQTVNICFCGGQKSVHNPPSGNVLPTGGNGFALSAVGVEPLARHLSHNHRHPQIHYWNNGQKEVDYLLTAGLIRSRVKQHQTALSADKHGLRFQKEKLG
jgi:hypothetical protein